MGDFYTKAGTRYLRETSAGHFEEGSWNKRGDQLVHSAERNNLSIMNTFSREEREENEHGEYQLVKKERKKKETILTRNPDIVKVVRVMKKQIQRLQSGQQ